MKEYKIDNQDTMTGYPSIDKPWLKYYSKAVIEKELPKCTLYEYMYENNKDYKQYTALNYFGRKMTYGELFHNIDIVADALISNGVNKGDVVSIVTVSTPISIILFYAINKIGAVSNFLNVLQNESELRDEFIESKSNLIITLDVFCDKVLQASDKTNVKSIVMYSISDYMPLINKTIYKLTAKNKIKNNNIIVEWKNFIRIKEHKIIEKKDYKTVCFYGHTGGTTGKPKMVMLSDYSFNSVAWNYKEIMEYKRGETFLSVIVPFVTYGSIINIHMPLCLGLELAIIPKFDADKWSNYLKKYKPNHIIAVPPIMAALMSDEKIKNFDLSYIKTLGMGGEGMNIQLEEKLNEYLTQRNCNAKILKGYGMTEVCATAATSNNKANKIGSVGIPLPNNIFMIYDNENGKELKYMQTGEICMKCESMMIGYKDISNEELIKLHDDREYWIHTGDYGHIDEDGFIYVEGRIKRMIITIKDGIGYKAFPDETEAVINSCEGVLESCVVRAEINSNNVRLKAYVTLEKKELKSGEVINSIKQYCYDNLIEHQRPYEIEVINEMPRTDIGKIDYRRLENMNTQI